MKKFRSVIAILILVVIIVSVEKLGTIVTTGEAVSNSTSESTSIEEVFPHEQVVDVNIEIDEETYQEMKDNAMDEEYVVANITYNGYTFNNVAIRPKGNSSLQQVANSGGDRFSFKVDFNKYVDGQNMFGITKINLNNIFSDDTLMAEYLGYEMLEDIGAVASDTTYVSLSINGEYFGLYLAVEEVDEFFLEENFGNFDGELYKPDMDVGADLAYISDDPADYSGVFPQDDNMSTDENFIQLVKTIDMINENGGETDEYKLSDILNVDSFLSYLALSTATIHLDSYQSAMYHNYYLYFNTDTEKFEWISWDLNMIFNKFPASGLSDEQATEFIIDEPVNGELTQYPIVQAVFTNDEYVEIYHEYLEQLINNYLEEDNFEQTVLKTYDLIEPYASIDPSAFFTIDQVKEGIFGTDGSSTEISLLDFVSLRNENISQQLSGELASTNNGEGNAGTAGMGGGKAGMNQGGMQMPGGMGAPEGMTRPEGMEQPEAVESQDDTATTGSVKSQEGTGGVESPQDMQSQSEVNSSQNMTMQIPDEIMELYEQGLLPEEISEYIANGELPPKELIMEMADEIGLEAPSDMKSGMRGGMEAGMEPGMEMQNNNQNGTLATSSSSTDMFSNLIAIAVSILITIILTLYLSFRKY